jgi:membrane-associated phospholipid phosphatase
MGLRQQLPSDTATLHFALAALIFTLMRRCGLAAYIWVAAVIAVPRAYLLYHHVSDVIAGAALGIGCVYLAQHFRHAPLGYRYAMQLAGRAPQVFYPLVFIGLYQITDSFQAVEFGLHGVSRLMHAVRGQV